MLVCRTCGVPAAAVENYKDRIATLNATVTTLRNQLAATEAELLALRNQSVTSVTMRVTKPKRDRAEYMRKRRASA